ADQNKGMVPLRAWITEQAAQALFRRAALDYEVLKIAANKRGFKPIAMKDLTVSAAMHSTIAHTTTRNVIGVVKGSRHPDDYVLYTAHWDPFGHNAGAARSGQDLQRRDRQRDGRIDGAGHRRS